MVKCRDSKCLHVSKRGHGGDHRIRAVQIDVHAGIVYQREFVLTQIQLGARPLLILAHGDVTQILRFPINVQLHERGLRPLKLVARALLLFTLPLELICEVKQLVLRPLLPFIQQKAPYHPLLLPHAQPRASPAKLHLPSTAFLLEVGSSVHSSAPHQSELLQSLPHTYHEGA